MKKSILIYIFLFGASILTLNSQNKNSQIKFIAGYMIDEKGDTLKGEIKVNPKKEYENHLKVFFKDNSSGVQKNYKPNKVKGYGYDSVHYIAIDINGDIAFYRRLCDGDILFFKVAFEILNAQQSVYDYDYFLFKEGNKNLTTVKQFKFKKQVQEWMIGAPEFAEEFKEDNKTFNEQSAIEVIDKYNAWKKNN